MGILDYFLPSFVLTIIFKSQILEAINTITIISFCDNVFENTFLVQWAAKHVKFIVVIKVMFIIHFKSTADTSYYVWQEARKKSIGLKA